MSYQPPHKRNASKGATLSNGATLSKVSNATMKVSATPKPEEFPALGPAPTQATTPTTVPLKNFASLFKNTVKKKKPKPMKWGMVRLTKNGMIDSLTQEEREAQEKQKADAIQEERLCIAANRLEKSRNIRREFDANYESPAELSVTTSEEVSTEEEEVLTDEVEEDEFEPDI